MRISFSATTTEARLVYLESNHRDSGPRLGRSGSSSEFPLPQYPSTTEQINAHLKALREDRASNADRRKTLLANAALDFLAAGGTKTELAEIMQNVPPDEQLEAFLADDPEHPRNRLTELLKKIPVVELP